MGAEYQREARCREPGVLHGVIYRYPGYERSLEARDGRGGEGCTLSLCQCPGEREVLEHLVELSPRV